MALVDPRGQNNRLTHPLWKLVPPSGKSWIHRCMVMVISGNVSVIFLLTLHVITSIVIIMVMPVIITMMMPMVIIMVRSTIMNI